jgi:hypothetical protein
MLKNLAILSQAAGMYRVAAHPVDFEAGQFENFNLPASSFI